MKKKATVDLKKLAEQMCLGAGFPTKTNQVYKQLKKIYKKQKGEK